MPGSAARSRPAATFPPSRPPSSTSTSSPSASTRPAAAGSAGVTARRPSVTAHALGDRGLEAVHLNYLAWAYAVCMSRYQDVIETATKALTIAAETGDTRQQAWARQYIASWYVRLGDYARAGKTRARPSRSRKRPGTGRGTR